MTQFPLHLDTDATRDQLAGSDTTPPPWELDAPETARPAQSLRDHGVVLSALGLVYLRHNDPARAMVLGLAAMTMGDLSAATVLMVAEAMLVGGDPEQALTVLGRFERPGGLDIAPNPTERAACHYLLARILHHRGDAPRAQAELGRARELMQSPRPEARI
ncbi:tetratricopeptide repeat protein [Paracoccus aminophilus]|uniref:Tetratricopeptide repeat protein n=1 Tax=Paracoccus aminophilus JCM 7686 TaxID=1367847 RepID=S5YBN9_PARAH|nr:tetratricopeptide repeat protein [Paracoccus aminophilus]AGT08868.1 hypothetical protein JCM7686_1767 [Paracoccus aminophilus JCM 7686]